MSYYCLMLLNLVHIRNCTQYYSTVQAVSLATVVLHMYVVGQSLGGLLLSC